MPFLARPESLCCLFCRSALRSPASSVNRKKNNDSTCTTLSWSISIAPPCGLFLRGAPAAKGVARVEHKAARIGALGRSGREPCCSIPRRKPKGGSVIESQLVSYLNLPRCEKVDAPLVRAHGEVEVAALVVVDCRVGGARSVRTNRSDERRSGRQREVSICAGSARVLQCKAACWFAGEVRTHGRGTVSREMRRVLSIDEEVGRKLEEVRGGLVQLWYRVVLRG